MIQNQQFKMYYNNNNHLQALDVMKLDVKKYYEYVIRDINKVMSNLGFLPGRDLPSDIEVFIIILNRIHTF